MSVDRLPSRAVAQCMSQHAVFNHNLRDIDAGVESLLTMLDRTIFLTLWQFPRILEVDERVGDLIEEGPKAVFEG